MLNSDSESVYEQDYQFGPTHLVTGTVTVVVNVVTAKTFPAKDSAANTMERAMMCTADPMMSKRRI